MNQICIAKINENNLQYESAPIQEYTGKWNKKIVTYAVIKASVDIPDTHETVIAVNLAFQSYADEIRDLKFQRVKISETPDITFEWVQDAINDPNFSKGLNTIMAYSGFPDNNNSPIHIKFNDNLYWNYSGTNFGWNPNNTILHELGHALGLVHSSLDCTKCIMFWLYNGTIDLQQNDIDRITAKYGKRTWLGNWYDIVKNAVTRTKTRLK